MISSQPLTLRSSVRLKQRHAAPPKPRVGHAASGAGSLGAFWARVSTVPLQSRSNASRFWIMLLLSSGAFEHGVIEQLTAQNSSPSSLRDKHQQLGMERPAGHQNPESGIGAIS